MGNHALRWIALLCASLIAPVGCTTTVVVPPPSSTTPKVPADLEALSLGPALAHRYLNDALQPGDKRALTTIRSGRIKVIEGLRHEAAGWFPSLAHLAPDTIVYALVDDTNAAIRPVAWFDRGSGDTIEISTGYRHRVVDVSSEVVTRPGPQGQQLFVYGFRWYPRWQRILPSPVAAQLDAFYADGVDHVRNHLGQFRQVARPSHSGGDLQLVEWTEAILERMQDWGDKLPAAPYVHLPESGTVDVRKEQFTRAVASGRVVVDAASIEAYQAADRTKKRFGNVPDAQAIRDVLLAPFRSPELYGIADRAIILDAVYGDDGPLRLIIDPTVGGGFFVPDAGDKEIHLAYSEVDLNFHYNGLIFPKLAHEAHHVIEFRERPFLAARCWHQRDDVIETLKYLNEFMWWVEHYPGDAPNWDWAPINAGIVLASLLEAYFPNSHC